MYTEIKLVNGLRDNKMSRIRRHPKELEDMNRIAQMTEEGLVSLITFLLALILVLVFKVGDLLWPAWIIEYQNQITGVLAFLVVILILLSPIIVEFNSNPRPLSGPGKNPYN